MVLEEVLPKSWFSKLKEECSKPYMQKLYDFVQKERNGKTPIYPSEKNIFAALSACHFNKVKVVIVGQDPYHGAHQAHGLSFSVPQGVPIPPSLRNIYKELHQDLGVPIPKTGSLESWAKQGVLLLNSVLTVRAEQPASHQKKGWEIFTDAIIATLNNHPENLVFILWGAYAQKKGAHIDRNRHLVLESVHPSPLSASRGFFGTKPFSQANTFLVKNGRTPIEWEI